ncbi:MAG TPA: PhnD/SsuA/transferrin family substrate-binding protein [Pseudobdellovibrionaceae bacterium]
MKYLGYIFIFSILVIFAACTENNNQPGYRPSFQSQPLNTQRKEYLFGIHPLYNPQRMLEIFGPLMDILSQEIPEIQFSLEASRNYADYDQKISSRKFHLALPNPYQTIKSFKYGYRVMAKMGDDKDFRGIILVRKDSNIKTLLDLKGKKVNFPAVTALAASIMPQYYMQTHGLDVKKDIKVGYVGSQESAILSAFNKEVAAGVTWPLPWKTLSQARPELLKEMIILAETEPLLNNSLIVRDDIEPEIIEKVKNVLIHLHENERGRKILRKLELSKFENATNGTYKPVQDFMKKYTALLGTVD